MKTYSVNENVQIHILKTNKFKDVLLSFRFFNELKCPESWYRTVLALMLADRCEQYSSKQQVSDCMDDLYGASASARTLTYGKGQVLEFRIRALNEKYGEKGILQQQIAVASSFLLHPLQKEGLLNEAVFREAMINLKAMIQRRNDNPGAYATSKCARMLGEGQPLGVSVIPTLQEMETITLQQVSDCYRRMIEQDRVDIFVEGQVDEENVVDLIRQYFPLAGRQIVSESEYLVSRDEMKEDSSVRSIDQTALVMMYPTGISLSDPDYWALRTGSCVYGQLPTSLLFQEVREKRSLCYSIYSSILSFDGVMSVSTGISAQNLKEVRELIEIQRKRVADGDFDEDMLKTAKEMLINSIKASEDDPYAVINREYQNCLLNRQQSLDQIADTVRQVTKDQIMKIFAGLTPKAVYALIQKEEDHEEDR